MVKKRGRGFENEGRDDRFPPKEPRGWEPDFQVRIENFPLILQALQKGIPGIMGMGAYEKPVEFVSVELIPGTGDFHIMVHINPDLKDEQEGQAIHVPTLVAELAAQFPITWKRGNYYPVFKVGVGTEFALEATTNAGFRITTGVVGLGDKQFDIIKAPIINRTVVNRVLADLAYFLEEVFEHAYLLEGRDPPREELVISAPTQKKQAELGIPEWQETDESRRVTFADIGGNRKAIEELKVLVRGIKDPSIYTRFGKSAPKAYLFWGPPGAGKTLMVRALANESGARFIPVTADQIFNKWVGNSEKNMAQLFEDAKKHPGKTIILIDEIDTMVRSRNRDSHEVTERVMNVLFQNLSGLAESGKVILMAATNYIDNLDPALIRPGRFDRLIEVPLPDAEARKKIFQIHIAKMEKIAKRQLFSRLRWDEIISASQGFSGADIEGVLQEAVNEKLMREVLTGKQLSQRATTTTHPQLLAAIQNFRPETREKPRRPMGLVHLGQDQKDKKQSLR